MRMSTMSLPEFVEMLFQKFHLSISTQQSLLLMMGAENLLDGLSEWKNDGWSRGWVFELDLCGIFKHAG